jgi:heptosyltransferase-2
VAIDPERVCNLAGVTSIAQSAALLRRCILLVGNDGGAMHLGDAMGCKVVSIVPGIEYPDSIEPWHNKALAVRHPVDCSPCYNFVTCPQGHNRCMTELPVERVLERCDSVLDQPRAQ